MGGGIFKCENEVCSEPSLDIKYTFIKDALNHTLFRSKLLSTFPLKHPHLIPLFSSSSPPLPFPIPLPPTLLPIVSFL